MQYIAILIEEAELQANSFQDQIKILLLQFRIFCCIFLLITLFTDINSQVLRAIFQTSVIDK